MTSELGGSVTAPKSQNASLAARRLSLSTSKAPKPPERLCIPSIHARARAPARREVAIGPAESEHDHRGVVDVRVVLVRELEREAARREPGPANRPVAARSDLLVAEPVAGADDRVARRVDAGVEEGDHGERRVPDRRLAGLEAAALVVLDRERVETLRARGRSPGGRARSRARAGPRSTRPTAAGCRPTSRLSPAARRSSARPSGAPAGAAGRRAGARRCARHGRRARMRGPRRRRAEPARGRRRGARRFRNRRPGRGEARSRPTARRSSDGPSSRTSRPRAAPVAAAGSARAASVGTSVHDQRSRSDSHIRVKTRVCSTPPALADGRRRPLHVRGIRGIAGDPERHVGLDRGRHVARAAEVGGPRAVGPLPAANPPCGRGGLVCVDQPEEVAQEQILGVDRHVRLELALPPALRALQRQQMAGRLGQARPARRRVRGRRR